MIPEYLRSNLESEIAHILFFENNLPISPSVLASYMVDCLDALLIKNSNPG